MKKYFYSLIAKYLSLYIQPSDTVIEIYPQTDLLINKFSKSRILVNSQNNLSDSSAHKINTLNEVALNPPDYFLLNGCLHYEKDIESTLNALYNACNKESRVIVTFYSSLWKPVMRLASFLKIRNKLPESNWVTRADIDIFLRLTNFEIIRMDNKILLPVYIPVLSTIFNRFLAPLPFFRLFSLLNIMVARPLNKIKKIESVSIIVPARNEAGNIQAITKRIPQMSANDEIIFIEGHSNDNTWEIIQEVKQNHGSEKKIIIAQQEGKGKADAVRKGFDLASNDILMILDADISVQPEDLLRFHRAIVEDKGEFINGSRLVYPMEKNAMRFFNILGNKFFAQAFTFVTGQQYKDTLCGTKVLTRNNYLKIAANRKYFGDFDPFGDFDLLFGASRMCLKIIDVPIPYKERTYGETNISRWKHGAILLRMLLFAARKIKFT